MSSLSNLPPPSPVRSGRETLNVRRLGSGARMLLLHGGPGLDHHTMLPLGMPLSREFEVWLPDLPGHGRSQDSGVGLPDLSQLLERTARWAGALDPQATVLAGHSLGAWIVFELLRRERVHPRAAVLISPPAAVAPAGIASARGDGQRHGGGPGQTVLAGSSGLAGRQGRSSRPGARSLRESILQFFGEDAPGELSRELVAAIGMANLRPPLDYVALAGQLRRNLQAPLQRFRPPCPVLILCGEADRVGPPLAARQLADATGGSVLRVLEGVGHVPFATGAEPVVSAILEFLRSCGLPPPANAPE